MLDVKKTIVSNLKEVQTNVKYELDVESPTLPLITYKTINDVVHAYGDSLGYSDIIFQIKVWATKVSEIASLTQQIDAKMRALGLTRSYYTELKEADVIIGVMQYSGLVKEEFI